MSVEEDMPGRNMLGERGTKLDNVSAIPFSRDAKALRSGARCVPSHAPGAIQQLPFGTRFPCVAKRSFGDMRSQAELGTENQTYAPPSAASPGSASGARR